jgi:hypothetical protein
MRNQIVNTRLAATNQPLDEREQRPCGITGREMHFLEGWAALSRDRRPGQSFIEFGITLIVLSAILIIVTDFARIFYYDVIVSAAANAGARAAAAGAPTNDSRNGSTTVVGVVEATRASAPTQIAPDLSVTVTPIQAQRTAGVAQQWTTVTVSYTFQPIAPLISLWLGTDDGNLTITRRASQRMRTSCALADGSPCT